MSQWIERVQSHEIWQELKEIGEAIDGALTREKITSDNILSLERIRSVVTYYGRRLSSTDLALIPLAHLDSVIANFRSARTKIAAFAADGDENQLATANDQADAILQSLGAIPLIAVSEELAGISEAAAIYQKTLAGFLATALANQETLSRLSDENQNSIAQIRETIEAQKAQLATALTEQQSMFSKAQDERATIFADSQVEQRGKVSQAMSDQQTLFSSDQDSRRTAFNDFELDIKARANKLISDYDAKLNDHDDTFIQNEDALTARHLETLDQLNKDFIAEGSKKLAEVERQKVEIKKLVGVIGNQGAAYGYQRQANIARWALFTWQIFTISSLIGLIFVAFMIVFPGSFPSLEGNHIKASTASVTASVETKGVALAPQSTSSWTQTTPVAGVSVSDSEFYRGLAARIFLSLTFGVFAAYAARQASRFMAIEQKNRKMALELQSLGPFIEPLPEPDQHKFRIQMGDRSFGVPDLDHLKCKEDDPVTIHGLLKSKELRQYINELIEAIKANKS